MGKIPIFFQLVLCAVAICVGLVWWKNYWGRRLKQWAEENNLILLHFRGAMFFEGPGKWIRTSHQETFQFRCATKTGKKKRAGSPTAAIGMLLSSPLKFIGEIRASLRIIQLITGAGVLGIAITYLLRTFGLADCELGSPREGAGATDCVATRPVSQLQQDTMQRSAEPIDEQADYRWRARQLWPPLRCRHRPGPGRRSRLFPPESNRVNLCQL
jgi:hypothetical protein